MAVTPINLGSGPGAGNGESLYDAFLKINTNEAGLSDSVDAIQTLAGGSALDAAAALLAANNATTALAAKAPINNPTFTGTVTLPSTTSGLTKANVQLNNVDNTSDNLKPVSVDQTTAINLMGVNKLVYEDLYTNFVATGLSTPSSANLTTSTTAGVAYIAGKRVSISSPVPHTYAQNVTTYIDLSNTGTFTYTTSLTITANSIRLASVVSNATSLTTVPISISISKGLPVVLNSAGTAFINPNGGEYAALPIDANGNIIAHVNHRTGLLGDGTAGLMSLSGGDGEIAIATDIPAFVAFNGVTGGALSYYRNSIRYKFVAMGASGDAIVTPSGTGATKGGTPLPGTIIFNTNNFLSSDATQLGTTFTIPKWNSIDFYIRVTGTFIFDATVTGTYRAVTLQYNSSGTTWVDVAGATISTAAVANAKVNFDFYTNGGTYLGTVNKYRVRATHDAGTGVDIAVDASLLMIEVHTKT